MTTARDPEALLAAYLADGMDALPDRVVDAVLDEAHRTRQRIVIGPWRTPLMNSALKVAMGAAAVVAVAVAGVNLLPGGSGAGGPASAVSPSPLLSQSVPPPSPSPAAVRFRVGGTDQGLTLKLPHGWETSGYAASPRDGVPGEAFFVSVPTNTFPDGCKTTAPGPDIQPTVEAIAAAMAEIPGVPATEPSQTTVAAYDTTYIELTGPSTLACREVYLWRDSPGGNWWIYEPDEVVRVHILDVDGKPVVIAARSRPDTTDEDRAATGEVLNSIVFDEAP